MSNFTFEETPEGEFIETVIAAQGELERKQNRRQVIQKQKARLEKGYWPWFPPTGYTTIKHPLHGKLLVPVDKQAQTIKEAMEGFASGKFQNQIDVQKFLQKKDFYNGKPVYLEAVKRLLNRVIYAGFVEYKEWGVTRRNGHHEPLISLYTFQQIQDKLAGKVKVHDRKDKNADFPLRGFVLCETCRQPLTASWTKGRSKHFPYYRCKTNSCVMRNKSIGKAKIEGDFEKILKGIHPKEGVLNLTKVILLDLWKKKIADLDTVRAGNEKKIDELHIKINAFLERIAKTDNDKVVSAYEKEIERLSNEELVLKESNNLLGSRSLNFETALDMTFKFLKNPYLYWSQDDLTSKKLVLKLVFSDKISYDKEAGFGTASLSLPLRVFELSYADNSQLVVIIPKSSDLFPAEPRMRYARSAW